MQTSVRNRKAQQLSATNKNEIRSIKPCDKYIFQNPHTSIKHTSDAKTNKSSLGITNASKPISKSVSTVATKQRAAFSSEKLTTTSLPKTSSATQFRGTNAKTEKSLLLRKSLRDLNSEFKANEKRENLIAPETARREVRSVSKRGEGFDRRSQEYTDKSNKVKAASQKDEMNHAASGTSLVSKSIVRNVKSYSDFAQGSHGKPRSKAKAKKAAGPEIFHSDGARFDDPFVGDFQLADLIEASLKNIRSPRNIFDYDFSYMRRTDGACGVKHELLDVDRSKPLKYVRDNVASNYFPGILEKLSEKSESYSEASTESVVKDVKVVSQKSDELLSKTRTDVRTKLAKSLNARKSDSTFLKDREDSRASLPTKRFSHRKIVDEKLSIAGEPMKTSSRLKAHAAQFGEQKRPSRKKF